MNKHDLKRKQDLISALKKAKEKARVAMVYLFVSDQNIEDMEDVELVLEHLDIALGHLGVETEENIEEVDNARADKKVVS